METIKNNLDAVKTYLTELTSQYQVNIHNTYCQENNLSDDEIYSNDEEFFNLYFDNKVLEAVRAVSFGEYKYNDEFIKFNGYGNLVTFNYPENEIDIAAIAEDILENPERYDIEIEEEA